MKNTVENINQVSNKELANAIRCLSVDAIEKAASGHPGMPLGMADVATILFKDFLKFSSTHPDWPDRDRFILSAGHGSMLLYSLLYLTGYKDITLDDIKNFRQLGSKTAGHPEYGHISGIETTTGPLGQGLSNAVGMAFAEKLMQNKFPELTNHYTYVIAGDGCLMEGISQEAISFAGHHRLNKLILFFDDNNISIDGETNLTASDNQPLRFEASNWHSISINGHDYTEIHNAIKTAQSSDKPTLIVCKTTIAYGSPNKSGSSDSHGAPLGKEEAKLTKKNLQCNLQDFFVPQDILQAWKDIGSQNNKQYNLWKEKLNSLDNEKKSEFLRITNHELPKNWQHSIGNLKKEIFAKKESYATRKASGITLELLTKEIPELLGGSADLTGSNNTKTSATKTISNTDYSGRYIHYGIREHAMAGIMNGIALHKGFIPYGGTFLVFSDYCKPAIRLSALMKQKVIYVMTHDSIGLGEDGPTHQPIEHLESLRSIPNLLVFRPCDLYETIECWELALAIKDAPIVFSLTRQKLPFSITKYNEENRCKYGAYVISEEDNNLQATIIATGSEIPIALAAQQQLKTQNISVRVVSMPCIELFDKQSKKYQDDVLGNTKNVIAVEAAYSPKFYKYATKLIGMESFGASGKYLDLYHHFGITEEHIVNEITNII